jgi:hypothetical protein
MKQLSPEAFDPTVVDQEPLDDTDESDDVWYADTELKTVLELPGFT